MNKPCKASVVSNLFCICLAEKCWPTESQVKKNGKKSKHSLSAGWLEKGNRTSSAATEI